MCGIAAIEGIHTEFELYQMMKKIMHRGPDDNGFFRKGNVSLGQTRLSIIDIKGGHQPIFNEDKTKCIVFNGEIYNFNELKKRLKKKHLFSTKTDTEVILHLYEEEGTDCIKNLDGMFAFAIYDDGKIFVGRDRLGIKPLYYGNKDDAIYFASEIKALPFCDTVSVFPPGYFYTTDRQMAKYYSLPVRIDIPQSRDEIVSRLRELFIRSVEKRLMSDVPVGVFLSGGVDSGIVASVMKRINPQLHSFSVGMEGSEDLKFARETAEYLGLNHHEMIYSRSDMKAALPDVLYYLESFDAPLVRSAIPCYFVSILAKQYVKVVLTGEGADEIFSGYRHLKDYPDEQSLFLELVRMTSELHKTNLQRVDRMTMANSIEGRVPFLDIDFLTYVFSIPMSLKHDQNEQEKKLLRDAFKDYLPENVLRRPKQKFSEGAGSMQVFNRIAEDEISDMEFEREKNEFTRTKEELYYYRIFKKYYPETVIPCFGRTEVF